MVVCSSIVAFSTERVVVCTVCMYAYVSQPSHCIEPAVWSLSVTYVHTLIQYRCTRCQVEVAVGRFLTHVAMSPSFPPHAAVVLPVRRES